MELRGVSYRKSAMISLIAALVFSLFQFLGLPGVKAEASGNDYKIVGYYPSWGAYGRNYQVMDMDVSKVTHINYAFADICWNGRHGNPDPTGPNPVTWTCQNENSQSINVPNGTIVLGDPWIDTGKRMGGDPWDAPYSGNIAELNRLKAANPHLRTIISVGGWSWSNRFSDVAADPSTREVFANSAVDFLRKFNFDGVDLDWEYPVSGGLPGNSVRAQDGANYVLLLQKIREKLDAAGTADGKYYELTIASGASPAYVGNNDLAGIAQVVDFINIMTYDFNGGWQTVSAHNAPLYYDPAATAGGVPNAADFNIATAVQTYLDNGVPPTKLVLGTPFYGRGWGGCANAASGQYQACSGVTTVGTWEKGSFDYSDLENNYINKNGYTRYWNDVAKVPYLYNASNGNFISYDDTESFGHKTDYIKSKVLAGAMFWEFSGDRNKTLLNKLTSDLSGPRIPVETVPPTVPGNLRTTNVGSYSVSLEWDASTDNSGVAGYIVSYGAGGATVTATSTTVGGLTPDTPYTFTVKAVDIFGNESGVSNAVSVTTEPSNDITPPTAPTNLQVGATTVDSIALSWSASSDDVGVTGYTVTYGTNSIDVNATNVVINGLDADTSYTFSVTARDGAGNVSAPTTIQASTQPVNACTEQEWSTGTVYTGGQRVSYNGNVYEAKWWTQGERPDLSGEWGVWKLIGACGAIG